MMVISVPAIRELLLVLGPIRIPTYAHIHTYIISFFFLQRDCHVLSSLVSPYFYMWTILMAPRGKSNQIKYIICIFLVRYIPKENCAGNSSSQPSVYGWLLLSKKKQKRSSTPSGITQSICLKSTSHRL